MKTAYIYATDENYVKLTAVSLCSLLAHNPRAELFILGSGLTETSKDFLSRLAVENEGTVEFVDVESLLKGIKATGAGGYVSYSTYSRLFIPNLLFGRYDRVLYIDCDTLVVDDLSELAVFDLKGKAFAIGYDCVSNAYKKLVGLEATRPYFNAGVLLIDVARWQERKCTERILDHMRNVRHDYMFGDQDYFSVVISEDAAVLHPRYNFLTHFQMFRRAKDARYVMDVPEECWYDDDLFAAAQEKPAIHHFLGHTLGRPWFRESKNPLRKLYVKAAENAGVPEVAQQSRPIDLGYRVQWLCWKCLPRPLFLFACRTLYRYYFKSRYGV